MARRVQVWVLPVTVLVLYGAFVHFYSERAAHQLRRAMLAHALVVNDDVWTLNPQGSENYLSLAAARDRYSRIAIEDESGEEIVAVEGPKLSGVNRLLDGIGLFPETVMTEDVVYGGKVIGRLVARHRNMNIYAHSLAGVIFGLAFVASALFLKIIRSKREIEGRVLERTAELRSEIEEREKVAAALRESEERFQHAMSVTKEGLWDWDVPTGRTYFSPGYYAILGYESEELAMTGQQWRDSIHADDRERTLRAFDDCSENRAEDFEAEFRMKTKTGEWKWILGRGRVVHRDESGNALRVVGTHVDITARKQAETERLRLETQLQRAEKMEVVGTLAAGVAHDLNNILGAIVGYPDLMLESMDKRDPMSQQLIAIKESGERAALIVQDLLTLARRGVAVTAPESLNVTVTRYLKSREFAKLKEQNPGVVVETRLADDLFNTLGSAVHLTKAVMNLCTNAVEAMPQGGRIVISTENTYLDRPIKGYDRIEEGNYVVLSIQDEGVGIAEHDLKRIFEPFYTKKVMGRSGTGLGMAVVWGTVKDHNGYLDVMSLEGVGTTFKLYFPVTAQAAEDKDKPVRMAQILGHGEKILLVDDVAEQRQIATSMLTRLNYQVAGVASGEEAVEYLKNNRVDLVILDMIMEPGIDGMETYRRITELHPRQKAVIASGFSETDRVKRAQELGAGRYLQKPYNLEKLGLTVKEVLTPAENGVAV